MYFKKFSCFFIFFCGLCLGIFFGHGRSDFSHFLNFIRQFNLHRTTPIENNFWLTIFLDIRLPRVVLGSLCGASLATAGVLSQTLFRNALASPTILGISGGSTFFAILAFYFGIEWSLKYTVPCSAFIGAIISIMILLTIMLKKGFWQLDRLLLAGLAISSLWGALTSLTLSLSLAEYQKINSMMHWLLGGLVGLTWEHFYWLFIPFFFGFLFSYLKGASLDIYVLGEDAATGLSIDVRRLKMVLLAVMAFLVSSVVSLVGNLPFIGLLVPHMTRLFLGPKHKSLLLYSAINGMSLTLLADVIARTIKYPEEIEVGVFTALMGAPFFLFMLLREKREMP